jgi:hypothetical protein
MVPMMPQGKADDDRRTPPLGASHGKLGRLNPCRIAELAESKGDQTGHDQALPVKTIKGAEAPSIDGI